MTGLKHKKSDRLDILFDTLTKVLIDRQTAILCHDKKEKSAIEKRIIAQLTKLVEGKI